MTGVKNSEQQLPDDDHQDGLAAAKKKERVKARWSLLREALMGSQSQSSAATNRHSMNSFAGFQVLDRKVIQDSNELSDLVAKCRNNIDDGQDNGGASWDFVQNSYTCKQGREIQFITREVKRPHQQSEQQATTSQSSMKGRVEALLSHRNHGVDNTGNVRVWDAEATLAGFLLSLLLSEELGDFGDSRLETSEITKIMNVKSRIRNVLFAHDESTDDDTETCCVLELGAGQAGLAGLAIASATNSFDNMKSLQLVLTDGHPKCVQNNRVCSSILLPKRQDAVRIDSRLLLWDSSASGAEECQRIIKQCRKSSSEERSEEGLFHLCFASDCVHFQEFHDGLFVTIARMLAVGGIALLCQPRRGSSLSNFMALVDTVNTANTSSDVVPLFQMDIMEDFHPKVSEMHRSIAKSSTTSYDPNWHRPLLLVMTKLRSFDEDVDGGLAQKVVKTYINLK